MEKTNATIGGYAPDFELPGVDGQVHHLARYLERFRAIAVVFMSDRCPYVNLYINRLKQIQTEFENQSFTLIGINANDAQQVPEDSFEQMKNFAAQKKLNFPYIRDSNQDVAKSFQVQVTPEVFLIDQKAIIRYRGQIDDNAQSPDLVKIPYLKNSISALLESKVIQPNYTPAIGSALQWRKII